MEAYEDDRYGEAQQKWDAVTERIEADETKANGKPGIETAEALRNGTWIAILVRDFVTAVDLADRAHDLAPDNLSIELNRAHALMFLGPFLSRGRDASDLYLAHSGKPVEGKTWEQVVASNFAEFRAAGLAHPMMAEIERKLYVEGPTNVHPASANT